MGMGRELALALASEGCSVAMCDVSAANMAETDFQTEQGIAKLEGLVDKVATQLRHAIQHDQTLLFLGI